MEITVLQRRRWSTRLSCGWRAADTPSYENRSHFYGIASRLMRQILVEMARARAAGKRSGEEVNLAEIRDLGASRIRPYWRWTKRWSGWRNPIRSKYA
jgi:hypothetical protein